MRLRDLKIENYGVFSGREIGFSRGELPKGGSSKGELSKGGDFQLLYGPNEAGKSTLLQLIRELLFGFAHQNPFVFKWSSGEMAAEAAIETADGRRIRFRRRKGLRATVVGEIEGTGERLDDDDLARVLGGARQELYQNVFGFSLTELSSGEKSLEKAGVSEALYGGGLGRLAGFQRVQETLLKRQLSLYKPTAKKLPINSLVTAIRDKTREQREAALKPRDYERMRATCQRLESEADELRQKLDELRRRSRHLERLEAALSPWQHLVAAREELAKLTVPQGFPADGAAEFRRARSALQELGEEVLQLEADLAEKRAKLDGLALAPELIENEAVIRSLLEQVRQIEQCRRDIPLRIQEAETLELEARSRLSELSPDWTIDRLEDLRTSLAQREAVQAMATERSELEQEQLKLEAARPELRRRIGVLKDRLGELAGVDEAIELRVLVEKATRYEVDRDRSEELELEAARLEQELELLRPKVEAPLRRKAVEPPAERSALESLPVPLVAEMRGFQDRFGQATSDARAARKGLEEARAELARRSDALAGLDARGQVPDREALAGRRRSRDDLWRRIRSGYLVHEERGKLDEERVDGHVQPAEDVRSLATRYEREVARADALADERQAKAELVAQAEHLSGLVEQQRARVREAEERLLLETERRAILEREWRELWSPCDLEPSPPDAMLEWLRLHAELKEKLLQLRSIRSRRRALRERIATFASELCAAMDSVGAPQLASTGGAAPGGSSSGGAAARLHVLLDAARRRVEVAAESARERERLEVELPEAEERLAALDRRLADARRKLGGWSGRWRALLEEFGFPVTWDVDLVVKIIDGLAIVREKVREARSLDRRVEAMRDDTMRFESEVAVLAERVAPDARELPAEDAVLELVERLDAAKRSETERRTLAGEAEKAERRLGEKRERRRLLEEEIEALFQTARAASAVEFEDVARTAGRAAEIVEEIRVLERELRLLRGSEDEAGFLEELERADGDAIAGERERLSVQITATDEARQDVLREAGIARRNVDDLEGGNAMAGLSLELESLHSELAESCDEWATLVLAKALLARALKAFEREHQPAMLREVARLFGAMTCGEYVGVTRKLDERGTLLVQDRGGALKAPGELSRGTREQLYLAIRLAYVLRYCEDSEPLPLVMDDVLVNFDDARARGTLEVLAGVSERVQVLFLTCHQSVVKLVNEVLPRVEPIVLPKGESDVEAEAEPACRETDDSAATWGRVRQVEREPDIFDRRAPVRAGSRSEVPGKESSLRRRPGPLE